MAKPRTKSSCERPRCNVPAKWSAGPWSLCSATCGEGTETRNVSCERSRDEVTSTNCVRDLKPNEQRTCTLDPCPSPSGWVVGDWTECDSSCGLGVQTRSVTCQQDGRRSDGSCTPQAKPNVKQSCDSGPCTLGAEVNPKNDVCNQLVTARNGRYLQSRPTGDSECTTTLVAPFGKTFTLRIEGVIDCSRGEYLKIKKFTRDIELCGHNHFYYNKFTTNVISIVHKTVSVYSGYRLTYYRISGRHKYRWDHLFLLPNGRIKSPGHPRTYPSNVNCRYRVVTTPGRQINLTFSSLSMQGDYPFCSYDSLEIIDVFGQTNHKYCGTRNPGSVVSTGNDLMLRFKTDNSLNFSGFNATYSIH